MAAQSASATTHWAVNLEKGARCDPPKQLACPVSGACCNILEAMYVFEAFEPF